MQIRQHFSKVLQNLAADYRVTVGVDSRAREGGADGCHLRQQFRDDSFYMDPRCIQDWYAAGRVIPQNQRQFRSAKNQALDVVVLFHVLNDRQQSFPSLRQNDAVDQFIHVLVVNIGLVILVGDSQRNSFPEKYVGIEPGLHSEPRAK